MTSDTDRTAAKTTDAPAAHDWTDIQARWQAERDAATARRKAERTALLAALRGLGVEEVEIAYDGYGDAGNIGEVTAVPAGIGLGGLEERLGDFAWSTAYDLHPGFENNDGGEGVVTWDIGQDRITVDHANFYSERSEYLHEDVE